MHIRYILILFLILISSPDWAQQPKSASKQSRENIRIQEVSKAIEEGKSNMEVAESYEKLARELSGKGEYAKAEDYLTRAKRIYQIRGEKEKLAIVERELAKVQEAQNKINDAFYNFSSAQSNTSNKKMQKINANDMQRVANYNNPAVQSGYIQQNILLAEELDSKEDKVLAYRQMAQVNKDMNNAPEAIRNLEKALVTVQDQPEASMQIRQDIASTYASDNQIGKAIEINKDLVAEAKETNNPKAEIKQLQALSENYLEANKLAEGVSALQQAYNLAIDNGQTIEAKNSLELLVEQYRKMRQPQKALDAYSDFMKKLEGLVKNDSTLLDERFFHVQEEKILRLEKERALKDELISRTNRFNYILLIAIVLILISLVFIAKALYSIKKKNKRIALQSLRREMNPHFIFNSLNSVNQFIAQNNELEANKYLSSYSKLMRNIMETSNKDFIPLATEMEQMKEYLDLEYMRFHDKFTYKMEIDNSLDADSLFIPNMLIQPQLENAIWHGLRYKDSTGLLTLNVKPDGNHLKVVIEDNGIGLTKSKELKTKHQKEHRSRGLNNTQERINLLNSLYNTDISISITEKEGKESGVIVRLLFPLMNKNL
ncbi:MULTISPECIES: histidine kinase [unclassified Dysgonomonas]|jgi:tetratricopeptide (TPR) repeat protein|uniref:tetratricopeptide repeat-containing sensor histidine kinase n=1 Tax=unclassified Dysgonomonas TaxID=2630389 RepID=UPI0025BB451A|nr:MULTISPECIES: histidine kinase [unclassified Dysgonomonas]MDR2004895.1 histidine kinase [Prevotella sp.]HMM01691.1 histidine kinase [Dysgonomonas sp.]